MTTETTATNETGTDEPVYIDDQEHLDSVVAENDVVLTDFYADWCGPCKMIEPALEKLAAETDAVIAKVDVDAHQPLAAEYGVRGVPTLVLFADGEQAEQVTGALPEDRLRDLIEGYTAA
ncbi:thioredoxin [Halovivax ruber XH-70]|uniref:Thioredoxin n=1 Tax=Halovivax ruber (strain DSM 18193 / JCM 13892 / XH-70) TaxID=797302 RepID=L0IHM6_HALRX|nr:thioredoxin [Halovivax ruber]AGB17482.1 thioredoxin [Halovivax ruber XH-70]